MINKFPVLYSFRRCPYAIRARLAIKISGLSVELREVVLSNKPMEMLECSPKGTVPVLALQSESIIDESRDIMLWALNHNDPNSWLPVNSEDKNETNRLIDLNDNEFKENLDLYKYYDRFPEKTQLDYRIQAETFIQLLEEKLNAKKFLLGDQISFSDIAVFPFIRQFAYVDKDWFDKSKYVNLQDWLGILLEQPIFKDIMKKRPKWLKGDEVIVL